MKPVINFDALDWHDDGSGGRYGIICERIGAQRLGYNLSIVPPGQTNNPFHNHWINEEMFLIVAGEGILRFGEQTTDEMMIGYLEWWR